mgnify:FL=1
MPLNNLREKFESFNWFVQEIDGHNFEEIDSAIQKAKAVFDMPCVILANTIPSKGVSEFERKPEWHGKPPKGEEAKNALRELRSLGGKITCGDH